MIPIGTEVEWTSQSQGVVKTKRGVVVGYLEPEQDVYTVVPPDTNPRHISGELVSKNRRYVVAVQKPHGKVTYYYTPVAEWLEEAWKGRGESDGD